MHEPPKPPPRIAMQPKPRLSLRAIPGPGGAATSHKAPPPIDAPVWAPGGPAAKPVAPIGSPVTPKPTGASIDAILKRTAPPWLKAAQNKEPGAGSEASMQEKVKVIDPPSDSDLEWEAELAERDRLLRRAKAMVDEKERALKEQEMLLLARERYLKESERLFAEQQRKRKSLPVETIQTSQINESISEEMQESFDKLKEELDRREEVVREAEHLMIERENFVQESEHVLFEKAQQLHELETTLEALKDELLARKKKLDAREGIVEPEDEKEFL